MTDPNVAINLIQELSRASVNMINTQTRNGFTKTAMAREDKAAQRLFVALTGRKPSADEIKAMLD